LCTEAKTLRSRDYASRSTPHTLTHHLSNAWLLENNNGRLKRAKHMHSGRARAHLLQRWPRLDERICISQRAQKKFRPRFSVNHWRQKKLSPGKSHIACRFVCAVLSGSWLSSICSYS